MTTCDDVLDLLPEVLPSLTREAADVQEHLRGCPTCAEAAEETLRVMQVLRDEAAPAPALSPDLADRVVAALPPAPGAGLRLLGGGLLRAAAAVLIFAAGFGASAALRRDDDRPGLRPGSGDARTWPVAGTRAAPAAPQADERWVVVEPPEPPAATWTPAASHGRTPVATAPARGQRLSLERYVTEAGLVIEAVAVLDRPDPHWLHVMARRVDEAGLIDHGERLLFELRRDPARGRELRPLIEATQVVLRKVRHAPAQPPAVALTALRGEVEATGLRDAYRTLLASDLPSAPPAPRPDQAGGPF